MVISHYLGKETGPDLSVYEDLAISWSQQQVGFATFTHWDQPPQCGDPLTDTLEII